MNADVSAVTGLTVTRPGLTWEVRRAGDSWTYVRPRAGSKADRMVAEDILFDVTGVAQSVVA